jgi:hypothetical protein
MNKIDILVDFDGTCVTHDFPRVGKDIGAQEVLLELVRGGHRLILFTMRSDDKYDSLNHAIKWFNDNDIPLFGIQTNPEQKRWTSSPKAYGQLIIDDIGLGMPLKFDKSLSNRKFVNWEKVRELLMVKGLIKFSYE